MDGAVLSKTRPRQTITKKRCTNVSSSTAVRSVGVLLCQKSSFQWIFSSFFLYQRKFSFPRIMPSSEPIRSLSLISSCTKLCEMTFLADLTELFLSDAFNDAVKAGKERNHQGYRGVGYSAVEDSAGGGKQEYISSGGEWDRVQVCVIFNSGIKIRRELGGPMSLQNIRVGRVTGISLRR